MQEMAFEKLSKKQLTSSRCSKRSGTMSVQTNTEETVEGCAEAEKAGRDLNINVVKHCAWSQANRKVAGQGVNTLSQDIGS